MDIWEKCNSYVQLKNEKWMYGEKVMENVLFYLAHWIYRKFFNNYVLLHEKNWILIKCFFIYIQKIKKYRIYEKIFLHMSMTRLSLQFLRYMLKRKSGLFEIERLCV